MKKRFHNSLQQLIIGLPNSLGIGSSHVNNKCVGSLDEGGRRSSRMQDYEPSKTRRQQTHVIALIFNSHEYAKKRSLGCER